MVKIHECRYIARETIFVIFGNPAQELHIVGDSAFMVCHRIAKNDAAACIYLILTKKLTDVLRLGSRGPFEISEILPQITPFENLAQFGRRCPGNDKEWQPASTLVQEFLCSAHHRRRYDTVNHQSRKTAGQVGDIVVFERWATDNFGLKIAKFFKTGLSAVTQMIILDLRHDLFAMIRIKRCKGLRLDVNGFDENPVKIENNCVQTVQIHKVAVTD